MRRGRLVRLAVLAATGLVMAWVVLGAYLAFERRDLCEDGQELGVSAARPEDDDGQAALLAAAAEAARRHCDAVPLV